MWHELKPFVPSRVCLSCDGCCRFREEKSDWRPRITGEEKVHIFSSDEGQKTFSPSTVDPDGFLTTVRCREAYTCRYLQNENNTCGIYPIRPFECQLYPFILKNDERGLTLCVHVSCPYIQEHEKDQGFQDYVRYLEEFFARDDVLIFLRRNGSFVNDYSAYSDELEDVFPLRLDTRGPFLDKKLLKQRPRVEKYLTETITPLSAFSFIHLANWEGHFAFHLKKIQNNLCVFATHCLGTFMYLPPLGESISHHTINACFEWMDTLNQGHVSRIENVQEHQLSVFPSDRFSFYRKDYEYVYYRKDLISLRGNSYKSKRSAYNYFVRYYSSRYLPYRDEMLEECMNLYDDWAAHRRQVHPDDIFVQMLRENRDIHQTAMKYHETLGLIGRVVRVDGRIKGYSFGYALNADVFCILFEIVDLDVKGLSVYIFREFCDDEALQDFSFINVMDDGAMKHMEQAKLSYRPAVLVPAYVVTRKKDGA